MFKIFKKRELPPKGKAVEELRVHIFVEIPLVSKTTLFIIPRPKLSSLPLFYRGMLKSVASGGKTSFPFLSKTEFFLRVYFRSQTLHFFLRLPTDVVARIFLCKFPTTLFLDVRVRDETSLS